VLQADADKCASTQELEAAREDFRDWTVFSTYRCNAAWASASATAWEATFASRHVTFVSASEAAKLDIPLRDIFGNPFRPTHAIEPAWLNGTVSKLATVIYNERQLASGTLDAGRLGALADALEEADCHDAEILGHLREPGGSHVRGCFVIDLLLGKS